MHWVNANCNADFQPAISANCIRQGARTADAAKDFSHALRITNLRYSRIPFCATWLVIGLLVFFSGCQTPPQLSPDNLSEPGWTIQQGQGLWQPGKTAPELAGDLFIARHLNGRTLVQFTKVPLPSVLAQTKGEWWSIEYQPQKRVSTGRASPPARFLFLHVAPALASQPLPKEITFERSSAHRWRLHNRQTGETLTGVFSP